MSGGAHRTKKFILASISGLFVASLFGPVMPARAQIAPVPQPTIVTEDVPARTKEIQLNTQSKIAAAILKSLLNGVSYFARKIAYDTAVKLATARPGQKPLAFIKDVGKDMKDSSLDAVADAIGSLGESFGVNLCAAPDMLNPQFDAYLKIGLRNLYGQGGPKPRCEWRSMIKSWGDADNAFMRQWGSGEAILSHFNANVNVDQSDFGVALGAIAKLDRLEYDAAHFNEVERIMNRGLQSVKGAINGEVKTPAALVEADLKQLSAKEQKDLTVSQIGDLYANTDVLLDVATMAGQVFLNTFANKLLDRTLNAAQGLFQKGERGSDPGGNAQDFYSTGFADNRRAAEDAFARLFTAPPSKLKGSYPLIDEYAACPDTPGLNNCVIDDQFRALLSVARSGKPLTIKEAMESGDYLNPDWQLISPRREFDNKDIEKCHTKAYCYSNIQKLRKVRVLPLGFEIAALKSDPDKPWKLGEVVRGFNDCAPGATAADAAHPYCHLIDPNWIVKAPDIQCEAKAVGPVRADNSSAFRREECVDASTCILEGAGGECLGVYGYCTVEKNAWHIPGESCPAQFATCKTFVNTATGQTASYLARTLDYGQCSAESVGCVAYATERVSSADGAPWKASILATAAYEAAGRHETIYFNEHVRDGSGCSAPGCTAFAPAARLADGTGRFQKDAAGYIRIDEIPQLLHAKKAPDYLGCYDMTPATPAIDWPATKTDVVNFAPSIPEACSGYASVCVEAEIGCDGYTPKSGAGPEIPAQIGANSCAAECVGYDAYKQKATNFAPEQDMVYLVPSKGAACEPRYAGCDEFTNIESRAAGGETKEWYTDLKYCQTPSGTNERVYYSWEGSSERGFLLKTHRLAQIESNDQTTYGITYDAVPGDSREKVFPVESPLIVANTRAGVAEHYARCNKSVYDAKTEPDCKALYHEDGRIFYRLLADTVSVSTECKKLRKTEAHMFADADITDAAICADKGGLVEGGACKRCYRGGRYENGGCVYQAIASESVSCSAAANGCRAYAGNTGNVVALPLVEDTFENGGSRDGWDSGAVVGESTHVDGSSLRLDTGTAARALAANTLEQGALYRLSFWAKGQGQRLTIRFDEGGSFTADAVTGVDAPVSLGQEWQRYALPGVRFTGDPDAVRSLQFVRTGSEAYYLDTVILEKVNDTVYLLKDKHAVPALCDANPSDGVPGEALGCTAYTNRAKDDVYTTGFQSLCRAEAIGCQPLWDTYNTVSGGDTAKQAHAYNVWCAGNGGQTCYFSPVVRDLGSCQVPVGADGCYIPHVILPPGTDFLDSSHIRPSTVFIPADKAIPIFLAITEETACKDFERGCTAVGAETKELPDNAATSYRHADTAILNDPEKYLPSGQNAGTLCREEFLGCQAWKQSDGEAYFKDPSMASQLCVYKDAQSGGEYGWFKKDVGQCSTNPSVSCRSAADCGAAGVCENIGSVPCYANNLARGGEYGIWSQKTPGYQGFVGVCEPEHDQCTELLDVQDTSNAHPKGQPYYIRYDKDVIAESAKCNGTVSLKEGCVLFDKTDNPGKIYNAGRTYAESRSNSDAAVAAETATEPFDANLILKVNRDRTCAEWLSCKSWIPRKNNAGGTDNLCYQYKTCRAADASGACVDWVDTPANESPLTLRLTEDRYVARDTSWNGVDYSGYSLLDKYPISNLVYLTFNFSSNSALQSLQEVFGNTSYIAYRVDDRFLRVSTGAGVPKTACYTAQGQRRSDWTRCGMDGGSVSGGGRCYNAQCIYPMGGRFPEAVNGDGDTVVSTEDVKLALQTLEGGSCKSFPEADSPFALETVKKTESVKRLSNETGSRDWSIARTDITEMQSQWNGVNYCQSGNCSCQYQKITYKSGTAPDYWATGSDTMPNGRCTGGTRDGYPCNPSDPANAANACTAGGGVCGGIDKKETHVGLDGYCLEYDRSRPLDAAGKTFACLTWLPIDVSVSGADVYNADVSAGYNPADDAQGGYGQAYCLNSTNGPIQDAGMSARASSYINRTEYENSLRWFFMSNVDLYSELSKFFTNPAPAIWVPRCPEYSDPLYEGITSIDPTVSEAALDRIKNTGLQGAYDYVICHNPIHGYLYSAVQSWAWKRIDPHAVVLRYEIGYNDLNSFGFILPNEQVNGISPRIQFHLLGTPATNDRARAYRVGDQFSPSVQLTQMPNRDEIDTGVLMHPPRDWTVNSSHNTTPKAVSYRYTQTIADQSTSQPVVFSTVAMSPGRQLDDSNASLNERHFPMVQRSVLEGTLKEDALDMVYFVPLSYPNGGGGTVPTLMTTEMNVPIGRMRRALDREAGSVSSVGTVEELTVDKEAAARYSASGDAQEGQIFISRNGNNSNDPAWTQESAVRWQYVMNRPASPDTGSYWEYPGTASQSLDKNDERNRIARRYVTVFATGKRSGAAREYPAFIPTDQSDAVPTSADSDPFRVACEYTTSNWFAVGMDFNADGEFLGYISRACEGAYGPGSPEKGGLFGLQLAVVATTPAQCTEFAQVYGNGNALSDESNKAWTNRVWARSKESLVGDSNTIAKGDSIAPFGSLRLSGSDVADAMAETLGRYQFTNPAYDGWPYSCLNFRQLKTIWSADHLCPSLEHAGYDAQKLRSLGSLSDSTDAGIYTSGYSKLYNLFSKVYTLTRLSSIPDTLGRFTSSILSKSASLNSQLGGLGSFDIPGSSLDVNFFHDLSGEAGGNTLRPPRIYSLNPATCFKDTNPNAVRTEADARCTVGERDNITIFEKNGTLTDYNGDEDADEDADRDGAADPIIAAGSYTAIARFFAFADDNKMPIRRVMVNWGDGSMISNDGRTGLYKNRKPYCEASETVSGAELLGVCVSSNQPTGLTCKKANDCGTGETCDLNRTARTDGYQNARFGDVPRACTPEYFEFVHSYTCGGFELADVYDAANNPDGVARTVSSIAANDPGTLRRLNALGFKDTDPVCIFTPKVQVLDNWGWCNGEGGAGYYNADPVNGDWCDPLNNANAWLEYVGKIIVVPNK